MNSLLRAKEIKPGIHWVGAVDWNLRNFHGYLTQRGTTYNAYLVKGEKLALIDTVKEKFTDEMLERISSVVDPATIDYVVCNHVEMDHSGGLPKLMEVARHAKLVTCAAGEKGLRDHFRKDWAFQVVKSGDTLDLGCGRALSFVTTPMVHWPDSMATWLAAEKLLFSNDAFGQHYASPERFDDELPLHVVIEEAQKYFGNIVLCFQPMVSKALDAVGGLPVEMIAPSHGLIWRKHVSTILDEYRRWATNQTQERALVVYDTMWDSTAKMARAIGGAFENRGIPVALFDLKDNHISDIMTELVTSKYLCVGSPTLNNHILPTVAGFLAYLKGLSPKKRVGLAFGSYGWGGQSIDVVDAALKDCGFEMLGAPLRHKYIPTAEALHEMTGQVEQFLSSRKAAC